VGAPKTSNMILQDLIFSHKANLTNSNNDGIDSLEFCHNPTHYKNYKYDVVYNYNSRGCRDKEWPETIQEARSAIWCMGDSFTVGFGSPYKHTWPQVLQNKVNKPTINVSIDGASNEWISSTAIKILKEVEPVNMILMWSYIHRRHGIREDGQGNNLIDDEQLRQHYIDSTDMEDMENFSQCIQSLLPWKNQTNFIHLTIPGYAPSNLIDHGHAILRQHYTNVVPCFRVLDFARDFHHFDILTSEHIVTEMIDLIKIS
jgi:hypothetical protein